MNTKAKSNNDGDGEGNEPFMLTAKPLGVEYTAIIDEEFVHPKQFSYLVHALENAGENDRFVIKLTTPGGNLHAVLPLLGAMDHTQASVHVHAISDVASAGTLLLMKADSVALNEYIEIMFHQVRFGAAGEGWNVERQVEHTLKSSKKLLRDSYKHFFTSEEIEKMLTGTPFYMDKAEFIERYTKRSELLDAELEAAYEAEEKAILKLIEDEEAKLAEPKKLKRKPLNKKAAPVVDNPEVV